MHIMRNNLMKMTRKTLKRVTLAAVVGLMLFPMVAQSACYINGPIVRVIQYDDAYTTTGCYIYLRSGGPMSSFYYYSRSNDDNVCSSAVTALTSSVDVAISGNVTSCPTTGTGRWIGLVNYMWVNP